MDQLITTYTDRQPKAAYDVQLNDELNTGNRFLMQVISHLNQLTGEKFQAYQRFDGDGHPYGYLELRTDDPNSKGIGFTKEYGKANEGKLKLYPLRFSTSYEWEGTRHTETFTPKVDVNCSINIHGTPEQAAKHIARKWWPPYTVAYTQALGELATHIHGKDMRLGMASRLIDAGGRANHRDIGARLDKSGPWGKGHIEDRYNRYSICLTIKSEYLNAILAALDALQ